MHRRTLFSIAVCFAMMLAEFRWITAPARGQDSDVPTTQSLTTRPANELPPDSSIRLWFGQLADADPKVREQARQNLMGISGDDLPKLRQLVVENRPASPDQSAALRDVVMQAFLASDKYTAPGGTETDASGSIGPFFLGLLWGPDNQVDNRLGVAVDVRLPGFPSYRFLRKGDMVLGVYMHPTDPLPRQPEWLTPNSQAIRSAISSSLGTQNIVLQVLRNGELINVPVKMAPRPQDADPVFPSQTLKTFIRSRADEEETYWQENFAPLLER